MRLDVLDAAVEAGVPAFGPNEAQVLLALRRAQAAYIRASIGRTDLPITPAQLSDLRRHASHLDLVAETAEPAVATAAWYVAATIFEWMSRLAPMGPYYAAVPSLTRGPGGDLIRSSLAYASGLHEGSSSAAAQRALDQFLRLEALHPIVRSTGAVILSLLARRFVDAVRSTDGYGLAVQAALGQGPMEDEAWTSYGLIGRLAEAAACQAAAMSSGSDELFLEAERRFAEARTLASTASDDLAALADRLARAASGMTRRSTYRLLREAGLPEDLVRTFGAVRPELWSNQVEAIGAGLLDPDRSFVLSLPTGSGKTFLAQLRILSTLERYPESWVAYVAPSRALVREAYGDLAATLRPQGVRVQRVVAGAEAAVLLQEDEVPAVTGARTCAVLTPERLDLYLRANPDLADTLRLVIVDEAHHIGDETRGPRLETLIALLRTRWPRAKPVLLSAFMPNVEEVRAWLGDDARSHASPVRPTRQLRGILLRHDERQLPPTWVYGQGAAAEERPTRTAGWTRRRSSRLDYRVGALISMNDNPPGTTPTDVRAFAVPNITTARSWTELGQQRTGRAAPRWKAGGTGVSDIAVDVAVALSAHPGLVLVFLPQVAWTESATKSISLRLPVRPELEVFARAVETIAGENHDLATALRHGCGYHHSQMPDELARIVEAAARAPLDVLCSTSGLQAGVNLPASIVVAVGDPTKPVGTRPTARDFANMAGRAGRPGSETEGLALFLPGRITYGDPLDASRAYLAPTDTEIAVVSALSDFLSSIAYDDDLRRLEDLPDVVQQTLLALWATNMRDAPSLTQFLQRTFNGQQLRPALGQELAATMQAAAEERGDRFAVFARTALPFATYSGMVDLVDALADHFTDDEWRNSPAAQVRTLTMLLLRIPFFETIARGRLGDGYAPAVVAAAMAAWISGEDYEQRGVRLGFGDASTTRAVRAINALSSSLAWGAGSLISLTAAEQDVGGIHRLVPYFIRFGVDSSVAAYLRLLGISDRRGALAIAEQYPADADMDYASVEAWTRAPAGRAAIREYYAGDALAQSTTEQDLGLDPVTVARPLYFSMTGDHPDWIADGSTIQIRDAGADGWLARDVVSQVEWSVGEAPGQGFGAVIRRDADRLRGVIFVG